MTEKQQTIEDLYSLHYLRTLKPIQVRAIRLLEEFPQAHTAKRLGCSRAYINKLVSTLERYKLIAPRNGDRYNIIYEFSPDLKAYLQRESPDTILSNSRVHNIRLKYPIVSMNKPLSRDKRTGYEKAWQMKGWENLKYWYSGALGKPSISLQVTPRSILAYPDEGQWIRAGSIPESEDLIKISIHETVLHFLKKQRQFGVYLEIQDPRSPGKQITNTEYAFPLPEGSKYAGEQVSLPEWWKDNSNGTGEIETRSRPQATALDRGLTMIQQFPADKEELYGRIGHEIGHELSPIKTQLNTIEAHLQGGLSQQAQINNLTLMTAAIMKELAEIKNGGT